MTSSQGAGSRNWCPAPDDGRSQAYFAARPGILDDTDEWHAKHSELSPEFKSKHNRFHPPGKESEAYMAVKANLASGSEVK